MGGWTGKQKDLTSSCPLYAAFLKKPIKSTLIAINRSEPTHTKKNRVSSCSPEETEKQNNAG